MSASRAIIGNTVVQVAGKFIGLILGLVTMAVMTRSLGAAGFGAFSTATSFLEFFGILVDFGLTLTLTRMISDGKHDESAVTSNILTLRLVSGAVFFGLAPIIALAFPYPPEVKAAITLGALSFFAMSASGVIGGLFQKHLATHKTALADVLGRSTLLAGTVIAAQANAGVLAYIGALVIGNVVQLVVSYAYAAGITRLRLAFDAKMWRTIIHESWPIGVSIAFNLIYLKGDVIILSLSRSQTEVGLYAAAYKVLDVVTVIPMIFMGLVLPILTSTWASGNRDEFVRKLRRAFDALSLMALPLAFGGWVTAKDIMTMVSGDEYAASGPYLAILMVGAATVFWGALFGHAVVALGMQRRMIIAYALDAILSLALYFWAVPRYGGLGAAWVTVFSEAFIMVATGIAVLGTVRRLPSFSVFLRALAASVVMIAAVVAAEPLHVLIRVALGAAVFAVCAFAFGAVTPDVLRSLRRASVRT